MTRPDACPECGGRDLYQTEKPIDASGGHGPNLLPGLGRFFQGGKMTVVACADCGAMRLFADDESRRKLRDAKKWRRV